ncbi:cell division protein ZapA [Novosphingopyxis sp.]|uniref:cell division protein ZapA n=1 Tax=Novosphingopyxis sp. TaxID=2709690 RepID=UPI003B5B38F5
MAQVSIAIGGRDHMVNCADGEEERIQSLGALIDEKLRDGIDAGAISETRALLYAALFLADELKDLRERAEAPEGGANEQSGVDEQSVRALENLADRVEAFASRLEKDAPSA